MDFTCIPPPPPEDVDGEDSAMTSLHDVPLPPGETCYGASFSSPNVTNNSFANANDQRAEWQRASEALRQSQSAANTNMPVFGGGYPYPPPSPMFPSPSWSSVSYGFVSNYPTSFPSSVPSTMFHANTSQASSVMNAQTSDGYPKYAVQYSQPPHPYPNHVSSSVQSSVPVTYATHTPQSSYFKSKVGVNKSRYSPYTAVSSSVEVKKDLSATIVTQSHVAYKSLGTVYSSGAPNFVLPSVSGASTLASQNGTELEGNAGQAASAFASYAQNNPQKQGPGAGGNAIRFKLNPNRHTPTDVKVSNTLLQRRPTQIQAQRLSFSSNGNDLDEDKPSTYASTYQEGVNVNKPAMSSPARVADIHSKDWPPSLQDYVARAIGVTPANKRDQVMQTITEFITNAYKTNTLFTSPWEKAPMPYASDKANEMFGLSPKREEQRSSPPRRLALGQGRGGRGRGAVRRSRPSERRDGDSSDDDSRYYVSKSNNRNSRTSPRVTSAVAKSHSTAEEDSAPEFIPLKKTPVKKGLKQKQASVETLRGKLMSFGTEGPASAADLEKLRRRQERFGDSIHKNNGNSSPPSTSLLESKQTKHSASSGNKKRIQVHPSHSRGVSTLRTVVGTCETVEKDYFRLTDAVDASQVRPVAVLERALQLVRDKWKKSRDYHYTESQLKSIRQDLRVQHVFSAFTVSVYETHARIALEVGDQAEFTQCLAQLEWLYETLTAVEKGKRQRGRRGQENEDAEDMANKKNVEILPGCENRREFISYRILYVMRQNRTTDAARVRSQLSAEDKEDTCVAFAFSVLSAFFAGDYQQFFSLYKIAPLMASYVMDVTVPQFRQKILIKICTAYRPNLPVMALKDILCFSNEAQLRTFLKDYKLTYTWMNGLEEIDTKASLAVVKAGPIVETPPKPTPSKLRKVSPRKLKAAFS